LISKAGRRLFARHDALQIIPVPLHIKILGVTGRLSEQCHSVQSVTITHFTTSTNRFMNTGRTVTVGTNKGVIWCSQRKGNHHGRFQLYYITTRGGGSDAGSSPWEPVCYPQYSDRVQSGDYSL